MKTLFIAAILIGLSVSTMAFEGLDKYFNVVKWSSVDKNAMVYPRVPLWIRKADKRYLKWSGTVIIEGVEYNQPVLMSQAEIDAKDQAQTEKENAYKAGRVAFFALRHVTAKSNIITTSQIYIKDDPPYTTNQIMKAIEPIAATNSAANSNLVSITRSIIVYMKTGGDLDDIK
ncbi:MAG: hypothetical protein KAS32_29310 [Candidatus Peribacteraceae bacterium]|nr:hypothetical protein [Candidatus Peribacteraceae bacterium]